MARIAIASNYGRESINPRSDGGLGTNSPSEKIRGSELWNVNKVDKSFDPAYFDRFVEAVEETEPP